MIKYTLYGLHMGDFVIRYVGQTRRKPEYRLSEHRRAALDLDGKGAGIAVSRWIRKHGAENLCMQILAEFDNPEDLDIAEVEEIARRRSSGNLLLNHREGGMLGGPPRMKVCRKGLHAMTEDNISPGGGSGRKCKECNRQREKIRGARRTEQYVTVRQKVERSGEVYFHPKSRVKNPVLARYILDRRDSGWPIYKIAEESGIPRWAVQNICLCYVASGEFVRYAGSRRQVASVNGEVVTD